MSTKPLLLLIDGHALVHRAYHALPPLSVTKTGEPVGAVYGFASTLLKVINELQPTHWAISFDRPTPTFRHLQYEAYKAQRLRAPDELVAQFSRVRELVEAMHIPVYELDGYEADDVLGTLARQASSQAIDTIIVTGDADAMQLVSPRVRLLTPRRTFGNTIIYDEAEVRRRYGVEPPQIADLKGLMGDTSDNIPGVPGIGEKTATRLIQEFGSLEGVYEDIELVSPPKLRQALLENRELALKSKALATIVTQAPVELELPRCLVSGYDRGRVLGLFRELEFVSLLPKLPEPKDLGAEGPPKVEVSPQEGQDYRIITSSSALDELLARLSSAPSLVFDVETTGLDAMRASVVGLALSPAPGEAYYLPVGHRVGDQLPLAQVMERVRPILEGTHLPKIAHNANYDLTVLGETGVEVRGLSFDTMIAAYLLGEKALGLKALAFGRLGMEMTPISSLIGTGAKQITMAEVSISQAAEYACADADITGRLAQVLEGELKAQGLWALFREVEMPLVPVLVRMQRHGVALDTDFLRGMSQRLGQEMARLEAEIYEMVGHQFNINSPQQLGPVLFEELKLARGKRTKTGYSTDAAVLEGLRGTHPVVELLLDYRQLMKLKSTYVDALPALVHPRTGRVHTSFNQASTTTGRLSSSDPNLQNIPIRTELGRQVRQAFIAGPGCTLLAADYSQIDLRVLAQLSQDPGLLQAFAQDEDIHASTASQVFGVPPRAVTPEMRRVAKTVNFGVIYGMSDYGLAQGTDLSREEAARFISSYFAKYPGVKRYLEATKDEARGRGYVETLLGRRRYIPEINAPNAQARQAAERMAINMPVQGTSADIVKLAMIKLQARLDEAGLRSRMILQVHDELIFEVPLEEVAGVRRLAEEVMPQALELSVPLKVEVKVGRNWGEMEG